MVGDEEKADTGLAASIKAAPQFHGGYDATAAGAKGRGVEGDRDVGVLLRELQREVQEREKEREEWEAARVSLQRELNRAVKAGREKEKEMEVSRPACAIHHCLRVYAKPGTKIDDTQFGVDGWCRCQAGLERERKATEDVRALEQEELQGFRSAFDAC